MTYRIKNDIARVKFLREAAAVERCHTSMAFSKPTVGHHTFNMLAMLRVVWPDAPLRLVWAILEHDVPERLLGDIPGPAKNSFDVEAKEQIAAFERYMEAEAFGDCSRYEQLSHDEKIWLKALDILELYFWTLDQVAMGNTHIVTMMNKCDEYINRINFPEELWDLFEQSTTSAWVQMEDL